MVEQKIPFVRSIGRKKKRRCSSFHFEATWDLTTYFVPNDELQMTITKDYGDIRGTAVVRLIFDEPLVVKSGDKLIIETELIPSKTTTIIKSAVEFIEQ